MKRKISLLSMVLMLMMSSISFATEVNFKNMDINEKTDWIIENIEPETYDGIKENKEIQKRSIDSWIVTQVHENHVGSYFGTLGSMETQARWLCDKYLDIIDYRVVKHNIYIYGSETTGHKYYSSYRNYPNNVRLTFDSEFTDFTGTHYITHVYNLHGKGNYDIRVIN